MHSGCTTKEEGLVTLEDPQKGLKSRWSQHSFTFRGLMGAREVSEVK